MRSLRAADRRRAHFRETDVPDVTGTHHVGDRADRVFDRDRGIEPRRAIDVDVLRPQPLERIGEKILHRRRPRIVAAPAAVRSTQRAEFHRIDQALARHAVERAADQHFVVAHAVEIAGVDQGDTGFDGGAQRRHALGFVRWTIDARRHAHAAEPKNRDFRTVTAQSDFLHRAPVFCSYRVGEAASDIDALHLRFRIAQAGRRPDRDRIGHLLQARRR